MARAAKTNDRLRLAVNRDECAGCGACPAVCHTLALRLDALTLEIEYQLCDNCELCVIVCPTGALYLVENNASVPSG